MHEHNENVYQGILWRKERKLVSRAQQHFCCVCLLREAVKREYSHTATSRSTGSAKFKTLLISGASFRIQRSLSAAARAPTPK